MLSTVPFKPQGLHRSLSMRSPGKRVVDEFYVHLSSIEEVQNEEVVRTVLRVTTSLPLTGAIQPNVAKVNLRNGRVSLLAYPGFFDDSFPELAASWVFEPGATSPSSFRRYDDTLNPPILHRKERLISEGHPDRVRWEATTRAAEAIGLFDETSTIGFRLNWQRLIASKGYMLVNDEFVPIGNDASSDVAGGPGTPDLPVRRHLTALSRSALSAPVQLLIRHGLLSPAQTFFDYGCGHGGDVAGLNSEGYDAKGWDPHFAPEAPCIEADLVNLGFVINVIEDPAERVEALVGAFKLARVALVVGVMLSGSDTPGKPFRDGFLTSRNTFQKYFSQAEFRDYLEQALHRPAFMVGPGVAFVFASTDAEQRFSAGRYRSNGVAQRLLVTRVPKVRTDREFDPRLAAQTARLSQPARDSRELRPSPAQLRLAAARPTLNALWAQALDLGRFADADELCDLSAVLQAVGSLARAERLIEENYDLSLLQAAAKTRTDDLRLFMAAQQFAKRPAYGQLEPRLSAPI